MNGPLTMTQSAVLSLDRCPQQDRSDQKGAKCVGLGATGANVIFSLIETLLNSKLFGLFGLTRLFSNIYKLDSFLWQQSANTVQIPTRIPEKIVVALFSGILVNSGIQVDASTDTDQNTGNLNTGIHYNTGKKAYDGAFYLLNTGNRNSGIILGRL